MQVSFYKTNNMKYVLIAFCMFLFSCKKATTNNNGTCSNTINSGILAVTSTALTASINQDLSFEVLYGIANGCAISSNIESIKEGNIVTVNMLTKFEGCFCTEIYSEAKKIFLFKSPIVGNFKLKFSKGNNTFIEKDVIIQ
jgi:hypothetical protein